MLSLVLLAAGCSNQPPQLQPVGPQTFAVGVRGQIEFRAYDPDADPLSWRFDIVGLVDEQNRASLASFSAEAVFTYTPIASDLGQHQLEVVVSDGTAQDLTSIPITVRAGAADEGRPRFIKPLGPGKPFYVDQSPCLELEIVVEDVDSQDVTITQTPPIPGSEIQAQAKPRTARFHWCPTEQQKVTTRYVLYLIADDGDNPPVVINDGDGYTLAIERGP